MDDQYEDYVGRFEQKLDRLPSEYFKTNAYISVEADEKPDPAGGAMDGRRQSRFFHRLSPSGQQVSARSGKVHDPCRSSDQNRRKLLWDNCARLYHIEYDAPAAHRGKWRCGHRFMNRELSARSAKRVND